MTPDAAPAARSAQICVRYAGPAAAPEFAARLTSTKPGYRPPATGAFVHRLRAGPDQCAHLMRSKIAVWRLSVGYPRAAPLCDLGPPAWGRTTTFTVTATGTRLRCAQSAQAPIGTWR